MGSDECVLSAFVAPDRQILPVPLLPMALKPGFWYGPYKGALAGVVEMVWGSMFKTAGRVGVGRKSAHGIASEWVYVVYACCCPAGCRCITCSQRGSISEESVLVVGGSRFV